MTSRSLRPLLTVDGDQHKPMQFSQDLPIPVESIMPIGAVAQRRNGSLAPEFLVGRTCARRIPQLADLGIFPDSRHL